MTDRDLNFDKLLESSLSEMPPDDIVLSVTPWKRAMRMVLIGFALCGITLQFWFLQYVLPIIGILLGLLGFRMLRRENGWFFGCYLLSVVRMIYHYGILIFESTIYSSLLLTDTAELFLTVLGILLQVIVYFFFSAGLYEIRERAGLSHGTSGAWLIVWYIAVCFLGLIEYQGFVIPILLIVCYVLILRSLFRVMRDLDDAGYAIRPVKIRVSDGVLSVGILLLLVGGILYGIFFCQSYPMAWQVRERAEAPEIEQVKEDLEDLGFPSYVLADLGDEDILSCKGALEVIVYAHDYALNDGRRVSQWVGDTIHVNTVHDAKELQITSIGVRLSESGEEWKIFHHFVFEAKPAFFGTEFISLWSQTENAFISKDDYSGHVLYDKDGETYVSSYYSLQKETYMTNNFFLGNRVITRPVAEFSFPMDGDLQRGYISFTAEVVQIHSLMDFSIDYIHQKTPWNYPFMTAKENSMGNYLPSSNAYRSFYKIWTALQFRIETDS